MGIFIARDPRIMASRLYGMEVAQPWTCYVQQCCYNIPLFGYRPSGPHNLEQEYERNIMRRKQWNNLFTYAIQRTDNSHTRSVLPGFTFQQIRRTVKLHLHLAAFKCGYNQCQHQFNCAEIERRDNAKVERRHIQVILSPYLDLQTHASTNNHYCYSTYLGIGDCRYWFVELPPITQHQWEVLLPASLVAIPDHELYISIACSLVCRHLPWIYV